MSDLSQTILAGTSQISGGMQDLIAARDRKTARKQVALQALNESFGQAAKSFKEYKSWQSQTAADNDVNQIAEAARLGAITKGPTGGLVALEAVRPSTVAGYKAWNEAHASMTKDAQAAAKVAYDKLQDETKNSHNASELANIKERTKIAQAELEINQRRDFRAGVKANAELLNPKPRTTEKIDPLSPTGIDSAEEKARRLKLVEGPKEPSGMDQPVPPKTLALLADKFKVDVSLLAGMTFRDVDAIAQDPQDEVLKTLRVQQAERDARDYETPELKAARKKLSAIERDLAKYDQTMATMDPFKRTVLDPNAVKAARDAKVAALRAAQTEVGGLVGGAGDEDGDAPVVAPSSNAQPTQQDLDDLDAAGLRWDAATGRSVRK